MLSYNINLSEGGYTVRHRKYLMRVNGDLPGNVSDADMSVDRHDGPMEISTAEVAVDRQDRLSAPMNASAADCATGVVAGQSGRKQREPDLQQLSKLRSRRR